MPQLDAGVVTAGLVAVVARLGGDRVEGGQQVGARSPGPEPPGAVPAGRVGAVFSGEGEAGAIPGCRPAAFLAVAAVSAEFGASAAVADGVAVLVGDREAPGGAGVAGGRGGQVTGQVGVDGADAGNLAGPVGQIEQGGQRDDQVDLADEPGRDRGQAGCARFAARRGGSRCRAAGP